MSAKQSQGPESVVREIRRNTRRKYSTEEKIRIVLEGLKGEVSIAELCRREGIVSNLYYRWSKEFLEAGNVRLQPKVDRFWPELGDGSTIVYINPHLRSPNPR